jgi:hypothetical protein
MSGGNIGGRGRFWRSVSASQANAIGILTLQPDPKSPAEGGGLEEGLRGPYADSMGLRDRTGPPKTGLDPPCCHYPFGSRRL